MRASLTLVLLLAVGCGGASPSPEPGPRAEPESAPAPPDAQTLGFPPLAELEQIAASPVPELPAPPDEPSARAQWTVTHPIAVGDPPEELEGFGGLLFQAIEAGEHTRLRRSASLRCLAQEVARFTTELEELPSAMMRAAIGRACGTALDSVQVFGNHGALPDPSLNDEQAVRALSRGMLRGLPVEWTEGTVVGFGFSRNGARVALTLAIAAPPIATLAPWPLADASNLVRLRLRTSRQIDRIRAWVNVGAHEAAQCFMHAVGEELHVFCPMSPDDEVTLAQIEIVDVTGRGFRQVLTPLLRRNAEAGRAIDLSPSPELSGEGSLIERVNALRARLGRAPLRESTEQSALNAALAPHVLARLPTFSDARRLVHGLDAGWRVEGAVQRGWVAVPLGYSRASDAQWLSDVMAFPISRRALVGPDIHAAAFGEARVQDASLRILTTYSLLDGRALDDEWFALIADSRRLAGLTAPQRRDPPAGLLERLEAVRDGALDPQAALDEAIAAEPASVRRGLRGQVLRGRNLHSGQLPRALFGNGSVHVSVAATHIATSCRPWCEQVVFVVQHEPPR